MGTMPRNALIAALVAVTSWAPRARIAAQTPAPAWLDAYRAPAARLIREATSTDFAWQRLARLTDTAGHRLSGSPELDRAITWAVDELKRDGLENVHTERVMVPKWVRGAESAELVQPAPREIAMLGLGGSVGTPPQGLQAETLVVRSVADLETRAAEVRGRIVVFNVPFTTYEETRPIRTNGASRAARLGAVAALIRSVGPPGLRLPHTGSLTYAANDPKIPGAAISTEDADLLQRLADRGTRAIVRLKMEAHAEPDVESANVVAELRGRELPDEYVVVGGHLDSWDVGAGASDDGGGCVATWEALRLMKTLGLRPRRTVRLVLWTNEENGARGGSTYRDTHADELARYVLMLESDDGVFEPRGFGFTGSDRARETVTAIASLLHDLDADRIGPAGGGSDIDPSVARGRIPALSLDVGGDYFRIHHTAADTVDKIAAGDIAKCAASIAVMTYVIADMPQRLDRY
jgi:carboxypeptidase Q